MERAFDVVWYVNEVREKREQQEVGLSLVQTFWEMGRYRVKTVHEMILFWEGGLNLALIRNRPKATGPSVRGFAGKGTVGNS